ncbi:glycosyltransferase family protein [Arthrobacter sp. TMT4-20]
MTQSLSAVGSEAVVIVEGRENLLSFRRAAGEINNVWPIVFPNEKLGWSKDAKWTKFVAEYAGAVAGFITDSEESKDEIESVTSGLRVEVVVIPPVLDRMTAGEDGSGDDCVDGHTAEVFDEIATLNEMFTAVNGTAEAIWNFSASKVVEHDFLASTNDSWSDLSARIKVLPSGFPDPRKDLLKMPLRGFTEDDVRLGCARLMSYASPSGASTKVGIIGTQLTFIDQLARELGVRTNMKVSLDEWSHLSGPPRDSASPQIMRDSQVVIAEWARPNNVWIQDRARSGQRLIVRAHRYEVTTEFPHRTDMAKYFAGVVIAPWVGRVLVQKYDWPAEKMVYIPNFVDSKHFRRPKLDGAEFTLGLVGIRPDLKRLDLALDLLRSLRQIDLRYSLRIRSALPPDHVNWAQIDRMRSQWGHSLQRIKHDPLLRGFVHFDPPGRDMSRWYRQIGVILSLSDLEGSHVALAEGISSGALPIARNWPGIGTLWPNTIVSPTQADGVAQVLRFRSSAVRAAESEKLSALRALQSDRVLDAWKFLIDGDLSSAQRLFGPIDWLSDIYAPIEQQ